MEEITNLRRLRLRYGIYLTELAKITGVCNQHLSRAELRQSRATVRLEDQLAAAIGMVIANRKKELLLLEADFLQYRGRLLETAEENEHERDVLHTD